MAYIGSRPADKALQTSDIEDSAVTSAKIADGTIASGDLASGVGGKILQVVSTTKTDTFSESISGTAGSESGDVTGLTVSITPSSTSNKVLILLNLNCNLNATTAVFAKLYRGGSALDGATGDAASNRFRASASSIINNISVMENINSVFLDSPSSTSSLTYSVRFAHSKSSSQTIYVNRGDGDGDNGYIARAMSSITAIEVSA